MKRKWWWAAAAALMAMSSAVSGGGVDVGNFDKWAQPAMSHRGKNGGAAPKQSLTSTLQGAQRVLPNKTPDVNSQAGGQPDQSPFEIVGQAQRTAPSTSFSALGSIFGGGAVTQRVQRTMGPYVNANPVQTSSGTWSGGRLGQVPNHHGWAGLKDNTKTWALRLMGAFPGLRFSSGFRSPAQNAAAGGVANSGHMRGDKVDFSGSRADMQAAAAWAKRYGARVLLHDAGSGYHLDISWAGVRA